jgi:hypothetical protein
MNRSSVRKRKLKNKSIEKSYSVKKTMISLGAVFQKSVNLRKIKKTDLTSFPTKVVVGFSNQTNLVMFEYSSDTTSQKDMDMISGFFSNLKRGDPFEIPKGLGEWSDGTSKKTDLMSGTFKFQKYKNNNFIIAEKDAPMGGDMYQKVLQGRHFMRPLQFSHDKLQNSKKSLSKIINYVTPLSSAIDVGSVLKIEGTQQNDGQYTVINVETNDGLESIVVSPQIPFDEDRIGMETKFSILTESKRSVQGTTGPSPASVLSSDENGERQERLATRPGYDLITQQRTSPPQSTSTGSTPRSTGGGSSY